MSAIAFVKAKVFQKNAEQFWQSPLIENVPCENADVRGVEWFVPIIANGNAVGYRSRIFSAGDVIPADAVKTIRVYDTSSTDTRWITIANGNNESAFVDLCNGCCGATPDMSANLATIPTPIAEVVICEDADGNYNFLWAVPNNPFGYDYLIERFTYNGGNTLLPAPTAGGYATVAAMVIWLNANWGAAGVWTAENADKIIKLVSTTTTSADLDLGLEAASFCLAVPALAAQKGIITVKDAANVDADISVPVFTFSQANIDTVVAILQSKLPGGAVAKFSASQINFTGAYSKPVSVKDADGTNAVLWTAGACA